MLSLVAWVAGPSTRLVRGLGTSVEAESAALESAFGLFEYHIGPFEWWCCRLGWCVASGLACAFIAIVPIFGQFSLLPGQLSSS